MTPQTRKMMDEVFEALDKIERETFDADMQVIARKALALRPAIMADMVDVEGVIEKIYILKSRIMKSEADEIYMEGIEDCVDIIRQHFNTTKGE